LLKFDYVAPRSIDDAIQELQVRGPGGKLLAGGTDLLLQLKAHLVRPTYVVDLGRIPELSRLNYAPGEGLWIGSMVRLRTIQQSDLVQKWSPIIAEGAKLVGSLQIRNLATIGGNLCNAAPSADVAPPLIAARAFAVIVGPKGRREVPLDTFFLGPRQTVLQDGELLLGVRVQNSPTRSGGQYLRHTPRQEMDIAVAGVASHLTLDGDGCFDARIVLGAVAPTPIRAMRAESSLIGKPITADAIERAAKIAAEESRPIDDLRGSADFRRHLVRVLSQRTLTSAWQAAIGGSGSVNGGTIA